MTKWLIGFLTVEFLFLLAWVIRIDRRRARGAEVRPRANVAAWPALENDENINSGVWMLDESEAPRG